VAEQQNRKSLGSGPIEHKAAKLTPQVGTQFRKGFIEEHRLRYRIEATLVR
jgi:hypothetical protein